MRKFLTATFVGFCILNLAARADAAGGSTCANAVPVYLGSPASGSTAGATGNPGCCNGLKDVWYYYDADFTGHIDISLFGSNFDTVLGIHENCQGGLYACNDDYEDTVLESRIDRFYVEQGNRYLLSVSGFQGKTGTYLLSITKSIDKEQVSSDLKKSGKIDLSDFAVLALHWLGSDPYADIEPEDGDGIVDYYDLARMADFWLLESNYNCENAMPVSPGQAVHGSTTDAYEMVASPYEIGNLIWYRFDASADGKVVFSITDSNSDLVLVVLDQCRGNVLAFSDDYITSLNPQITISAAMGQTYYVAVGGFPQETGEYTLEVVQDATSAPANDLQTNAIVVTKDIPYSGTNTGASGSTYSLRSGNIQNDVWYAFTASVSQTLTFHIPSSDFDTVLVVRDSSGHEITSNDDAEITGYGQVRHYDECGCRQYLLYCGRGSERPDRQFFIND